MFRERGRSLFHLISAVGAFSGGVAAIVGATAWGLGFCESWPPAARATLYVGMAFATLGVLRPLAALLGYEAGRRIEALMPPPDTASSALAEETDDPPLDVSPPPRVRLEPLTDGFAVVLRVHNDGAAGTFECAVDRVDGIVETFSSKQPGAFIPAWNSFNEGVQDLRSAKTRPLKPGGWGDVLLVSREGRDAYSLYDTARAWQRHFRAQDSENTRISFQLRILSDHGATQPQTLVVRCGRAVAGGLWVEDVDGTRLVGQPGPDVEVFPAGSMLRLRVRNNGDTDTFRIKVDSLTGTGEKEDPYDLPWREGNAKEVEIATSETAIVNVAEPNTTMEAAALLLAGGARKNIVRFFTAHENQWFDRTIPADQPVRLKTVIYRRRTDSAPISYEWILVVDESGHASLTRAPQ